MRTVATRRWLALAAGLMIVACSDARSPAEPTSPAAEFSVASDAAHARHEALARQLEERRSYFKAMKEASRDSVRVAKAEWKAWKEDWKAQRKAAMEAWRREHHGEKGGPDIELLRCEPQEYTAEAAIIGPNGGKLHAGPHEIEIPKGALDHEELIVAEAPTSSLVDVRFSPHGLQFQKPVQAQALVQGLCPSDDG